MPGCIVSNYGTQAILRVQIDTIFEWVLSFLHLSQMPQNQLFSERQMHHAWAAIVLLIGIAAFSIFQSVKNNDSLLFRVAIVIFCTQGIITSFNQLYQPEIIEFFV